MTSVVTVVLSALLLGLTVATARAVSLLQVDTFEDGTTQNWTAGGVLGGLPAPPANVVTGGPAGAGDNYLQITAIGGSGPGSRLSAFNLTQWAGDYLAAGVTEITMQLNNFGPDDVSLRLMLADPAGGPPSNLAITAAELIPAGSGWVSADFSLSVADLVALIGSATGALSGATKLRLFHNPLPDFPGPGIGPPPVNVVLGVDKHLRDDPARRVSGGGSERPSAPDDLVARRGCAGGCARPPETSVGRATTIARFFDVSRDRVVEFGMQIAL